MPVRTSYTGLLETIQQLSNRDRLSRCLVHLYPLSDLSSQLAGAVKGSVA